MKKYKIAALLPALKFIINHPLNKQQKVGALFRFLRWQLGSRLVPGQIVYNWINDAKFIVQPGETGFTGNIYCGLYDFSDMAYILHVIEAQDLFIDVGANVGAYTILACASKGASGYCFEPEPTIYQRLIENIRLNDLANRVKPFCIGLSDQEGELTFTSGLGTKNHVVTSIGESTNILRIKVLPLDKILVGKLPSMLKIDVEGFETSVLRGAQATLSNPSLHSVIMELNGNGSRYGFSDDAILKIMKNYGFSTYYYEPFSREIKALNGINKLSANTLFIRNEEVVREKIARAPRISIGKVQL